MSLTEDTAGCAPGRGSIVISVSGGTAPYQYSTDSISYQNSNRFNCLLSGTYSVYIKDSTLCPDNSSIQITGVALLVNLIDFTAEPEAGKVICRWSTSEEINSGHFTIARSLDAQHWETLGTVAASGSSNISNNYLLEDGAPHYGNSYYKLIETDKKGIVSELGIRQVFIGEGEQLRAEPNPANDFFILEGCSNNAVISIQTIEGIEISFNSELQGDALKINTKQWQEGVYIITVSRNGKMKQLKLVVVHD
jgi:hypothetical protein